MVTRPDLIPQMPPVGQAIGFVGKDGLVYPTEEQRRLAEFTYQVLYFNGNDQINDLNGDITILTGTVGGFDSQISDLDAAVAAVEGDVSSLSLRYGVQLNVNGYVTGFLQNNDGTSGTFTILADKFKIIDPSGGGSGTPVVPFEISGGVVYIQKARIHELDADNFAVNGDDSIGITGTDTLDSLTDAAYPNWTDMASMTVTRTFDKAGVAVVHGYFSCYTSSDNDTIEITLLANGTAMNGGAFAHQTFPEADRPARLVGFASAPFAAGTHTFKVQWRVDDGTARVTQRALLIEFYKGASFSGLIGNTANTGGGSGATGGSGSVVGAGSGTWYQNP